MVWMFVFFLNDRAPTETYTLPLPDALPRSVPQVVGAGAVMARPGPLATAASPRGPLGGQRRVARPRQRLADAVAGGRGVQEDRKSTRLNSSHSPISYGRLCLKTKKTCHRAR